MRTQHHRHALRPGATFVEVLVAVGCICIVLFVILMPAFSSRPRVNSRQVKDSTQIRGVHQGMVLWAQSSRDEYPLPSFSDTGNYVLSVDDATQKDTTANIYSLLIFGNYFSPELLVSPSEQSPDIQIDTDYYFTSPPSALNPSMALWDPAFSADFTDGTIGNTSYAHHIPASDRRSRWASTLQSDQAIVGNRGPEVSAVQLSKSNTPLPQFAIPNSVTLLIHGGRTTWEGNIAYNDNHVILEKSVFSDSVPYTANPLTPDAKPRTFFDVFFFDEPDAVNNDNAFLSIFTKAGPTTKDFKPIWD